MKQHQMWQRAASAAAVAAIALGASTASADPPTTPSNFDPDSFGNNMVFLGVTATSSVYFSGFCDQNPDLNTPPNRCVDLGTGSALIPFSFPDLGSIYIPPNSTKTIIWPVFIQNARYRLSNATSTQTNGIFQTNMIFTIESDVLKDPSVMCPDPNPDPTIEEPPPIPCNGRFVTVFPNAYGEDISLAAGQHAFRRVRAGSAGIGGFGTGVFAGLNMSAKLIKKMFASPMTIRVGLSGRVKLVDPATAGGNWAFVGVRLIGDR